MERYRYVQLLLLLILAMLTPAATGAAEPDQQDADVRQQFRASQSEADLTPLTALASKPAAHADEHNDEHLDAAAFDELAPVRAAQSFTDIRLTWRAAMPADAHLHIELRASVDGKSWTKWVELEASGDVPVSDDPELYVSSPVYAGRAQWWQARVAVEAAPDGKLPVLKQLSGETIDVGETPASKQPAPVSVTPKSPNAVAMPAVMRRVDWGSPDGQGSRAEPAYYRANHLVVHHTADGNSLTGNEGWWGDRVRGIWYFHAISNGWGDIGYNFLVSPDGTLFEGRAGAGAGFTLDNVGFHDTGNYGSMGVALIGNFTSVRPSDAALNTLVPLLAWKAEQRGIDVLGSSYYYGCDISRYCGNGGAITPNLGGHRDVANNPAGYTSCPGGVAYTILPEIRSRVNALMSSNPDNGDETIDELESSFIRNAATWYDSACGSGGHSFYTYATDNPDESTNVGRWRKTGLDAGNYRIFVYLPAGCDMGTLTSSAKYKVWQGGVQRGEFVIDQQARQGDWVDITASVGSLALSDLPVEVILSDLTAEPLGWGRAVVFDSVRFVRVQQQGHVVLDSVSYNRTTLYSGDVLEATYTIRNAGNAPVTLGGQAPFPITPYQPSTGYVYDEAECFLGDGPPSNYPAFPKQTGSFRVMLGIDGFQGPCAGSTSGYQWRWGVNRESGYGYGDSPTEVTLDPGETTTVIGAVRFRNPAYPNNTPNGVRTVTLRAGLVQEYVGFIATDAAVQQITVLPENRRPQPGVLSGSFQPMARVYHLQALPTDFLARTANPLSISEGSYAGSFAWDGSYQNWAGGGPVGMSDLFVVAHVRQFTAPSAGTYTFELTADDGAWLWVDGQLVVDNSGMHVERAKTGSVYLGAGEHTLSIKYFEHSGDASLGYRWQTPGASGFSQIPVSTGSARKVDSILGPGTLSVAADDLGGSGVASIRWSLNNGPAQFTSGRLLAVPVSAGAQTLRYQVLDSAGNWSDEIALTWTGDLTPPTSSLAALEQAPSGMPLLTLSGNDALAGVDSFVVELRDPVTGQARFFTGKPGIKLAVIGTPGSTYEIRVRAIDRVGNEESRHSLADGTVTIPPWAQVSAVYLPVVR